uniref:Uncharacterized protein n=1 Tax=Rousettus aegyptiacus TaxID=9407 RepID=A0A7J8JI21_ROUAE|nr:hypothetical protein HJG63_010254 [Rousettus aegyptiacus]
MGSLLGLEEVEHLLWEVPDFSSCKHPSSLRRVGFVYRNRSSGGLVFSHYPPQQIKTNLSSIFSISPVPSLPLSSLLPSSSPFLLLFFTFLWCLSLCLCSFISCLPQEYSVVVHAAAAIYPEITRRLQSSP